VYARQAAKVPLLSREREHELALLSQAGDQAAREALICANTRWAIKLARQYEWTGIPLEDLVQEANCALIRAIDRFDPARKTRVTSYVAAAVRQELWKLHLRGGLIYTPALASEESRKRVRVRLADLEPLTRDARRISTQHDPAEWIDAADRMRAAMRTLTARQRTVLLRRADGQTFKDISVDLGVSRQRVQQIQVEAMNRLRHNLTKGDQRRWLEPSRAA
jgi:RNA polymerase sigma factor (sigma-70 family)